MEEQLEVPPQLLYSPTGPLSAQVLGASIPVAADRLYQLAALTAGLFLLFTLL